MTTTSGPEVQPPVSNPEKVEPSQSQGGEARAALARRERIDSALDRVEEVVDRIGGALERPLVGATVAGGLIAAAAGVWGPTQAVLGAAVGVVAYRMLKRRHRSPEPVTSEAAR